MSENVVKLENNFNQVIQRKIAVIFVTDVVGFSKLMEINEDETLKSFRACKDILDKLFAEHGGRIFNTAGDSVLAEFHITDSKIILTQLCTIIDIFIHVVCYSIIMFFSKTNHST